MEKVMTRPVTVLPLRSRCDSSSIGGATAGFGGAVVVAGRAVVAIAAVVVAGCAVATIGRTMAARWAATAAAWVTPLNNVRPSRHSTPCGTARSGRTRLRAWVMRITLTGGGYAHPDHKAR